MRYRNDDYFEIIRAEDDVERKMTKYGLAKTGVAGIKGWKDLGRVRNPFNQAIELIQDLTAARSLRSAYQAAACSASSIAAEWRRTFRITS